MTGDTAIPLVPQVPGAPLLGSYRAYRRNPLAFYSWLGRRYGDICAYRLLWSPAIFINAPRLIQSLLVEHAADYDKGEFQRSLFRPFVGNGLVNSEGALHDRQRKLLAPAFQPRHLSAYAATMVDYADHWQARRSEGDVVDIHTQMMGLTMQVVGKVLLGADVSADAGDVSAALNTAVRWFQHAASNLLTPPLAVPTPINVRTNRAIAVVKRTVQDIIAAHQGDDCHRDAAGERGDLLTMLLRARDDEGRGMSDQQVLDEVLTFFVAGHETTAVALTWTFYLLARHREVTERLQAELDDVLDGRLPTYDDLPRLPYTLQIIKEAMRLYPPSSGIVRMALRDTVLGEEYPVQKDTPVVFSQYVLHHRPDYFPDPERFDPERFRPADEQKLPRYAYLPFGAGHRICIGNHFATMEAHLLLATIAQRLRFAPVDPTPVRPELALTLRPSRPILLRVARRAPGPVNY